MRRPSSLQIVTVTFVLVLVTVAVTFVVLALRSDRLGDPSPGITNPSLTAPENDPLPTVTTSFRPGLAYTP
ncbi:hypothetical protein AB0L40_20540 [Patulibacter sp. NPDC049589]|uniref:hypothetical protein n=1 Tax=Patulibacter sp. NPDC049589 TaxID=3154731 RepID=UPI00343B5019